jgi:hypothetical protein
MLRWGRANEPGRWERPNDRFKAEKKKPLTKLNAWGTIIFHEYGWIRQARKRRDPKQSTANGSSRDGAGVDSFTAQASVFCRPRPKWLAP